MHGRSPVQETFQLAIRREQPADLASASEPDCPGMVTHGSERDPRLTPKIPAIVLPAVA